MELSKAPTVQEFTGTDTRIIKIRVAEGDADKVIDKLSADVPGMKELEKDAAVSSVSSALGSSFLKTACWALLAGLLGITLYLSIRFEWSFAMGALVSTAHDVLAIIALVVLLGTELSIIHIGAFLTVAGYSINDTIVIYDRIRERLRMAEPNEDLKDIMNEAINTTLSRTLLTSGSTIAVLISLIFLGGPSMFDFSVAMLLGIFQIISGVFSLISSFIGGISFGALLSVVCTVLYGVLLIQYKQLVDKLTRQRRRAAPVARPC